MKRLSWNKHGFTLLELLIVVVILAVLAGLALPQYIRTIARSKEAEGWQNLATLRSAETRYYAEWEKFTGTVGLLDVEDPNAATRRYFKYFLTADNVAVPPTFTLRGDPTPVGGVSVTGVRTLTLNKDGSKVETP